MTDDSRGRRETRGDVRDRRETDGGVVTGGSAWDAVAATDSPASGGDESLRRQVAAVARTEYRLSIRNRWAFALTALFTLFGAVVVLFGASNVGPVRVGAVVVSLASLATYLLPLAALVFGFDAVVGAEERGWLDVVFALPVSRARVVVGAFLGRAVTLTAAVVVGFGAGGVLLFWTADGVDAALYATFLVASVALGLAFLAVGVLVSAVAGEKTHALGAALVVWVWFVFGHDLVALGIVAGFRVPDAALSALVLSNPVGVFRVLVLSGVDAAGGGLTAVVADSTLSIPVLAAAAAAWVLAPLAAAARLVRRRHL